MKKIEESRAVKTPTATERRTSLGDGKASGSFPDWEECARAVERAIPAWPRMVTFPGDVLRPEKISVARTVSDPGDFPRVNRVEDWRSSPE